MISEGTLPCGSGNGQVKLSLSYVSQERQLIVSVHACRCVLQHCIELDSVSLVAPNQNLAGTGSFNFAVGGSGQSKIKLAGPGI